MLTVFTIASVCIILLLEYCRPVKFKLDAFRMTLFFFILAYFVIPEVLPLSYACYPFCNGVPWEPRVVAFIGVGALFFGYALSYGIPVFYINRKVVITENRKFRFLAISTAISVVSLIFYAKAFGGFRDALSYGALQRFSGQQHVELADSVIALYFVGIAAVVFAYSFWEICKNARSKYKYICLLLVCASVVVVFGLIHGGRGVIFNLLLIVIFLYVNVHNISWQVLRISTIKLFFLLSIVSGLFLLVTTHGKTIIGSISSGFRGDGIDGIYSIAGGSKGVSYIWGRLISEFSHSIKSIGVLVSNSNTEWNLFYHFWVAPLHLIPTRLLGIEADKPFRITEVNTEMLTGSSVGGIPPGIIASLWYGAGFSGVLLGMIVYGIALGWFQRQCYAVIKVYPAAIPIVLYAFYVSSFFVMNGDPSVFLKHNFAFIVFLLLVFLAYIICRINIFSPYLSKYIK